MAIIDANQILNFITMIIAQIAALINKLAMTILPGQPDIIIILVAVGLGFLIVKKGKDWFHGVKAILLLAVLIYFLVKMGSLQMMEPAVQAVETAVGAVVSGT